MKTVWLVINNDKLAKYSDRYRIFEEDAEGKGQEAALAFARSVGFQDPYGMGISPRTGMATKYMCGGVDISIIRLEVSESNYQKEKTCQWDPRLEQSR